MSRSYIINKWITRNGYANHTGTEMDMNTKSSATGCSRTLYSQFLALTIFKERRIVKIRNLGQNHLSRL